jgi:DNA polymerase-3 subunit delta'
MPFHDIIGHESPKALLKAAIRQDRIAHAYLFHGERGIGKRLTALRFAQALNCDMAAGPGDPDTCGHCRSCRQIEACTHPDFTLIEPDPEQATPQIKIEQIREIESQIVYRPLIGRWKVCLIDHADRLTIGAANALLKTLEEPPPHCLFLLVTSRPSALPATIRSRCQALRFATPARSQVEQALIAKRGLSPAEARFLAVLSEGRLGEALKMDPNDIKAARRELLPLTDPASLHSVTALLAAAEALAKTDRAQEALAWLTRWLRDLLLVRVGADPDALLNLDCLPALQAMAGQLDVTALLDLLGDIEVLEQQVTRNLNMQLALECILLRLRDAMVTAQGSKRELKR